MSLLAPVARYTHFVRFSKRTLIALALGLTVAVIVTAWINSADNGARITLGGGSGKPAPADMIRPRYQGLDSHDRPFNILAARATQPDPDTVNLDQMNADITLTDTNSWVSVSADEGVYHVQKKLLEMTGHVDLFYEGGYEFRSNSAQVDVNAGSSEGNEPVEGQGPSMILKADRFKVLDRGANLLFNDDVHVTLYLR